MKVMIPADLNAALCRVGERTWASGSVSRWGPRCWWGTKAQGLSGSFKAGLPAAPARPDDASRRTGDPGGKPSAPALSSRTIETSCISRPVTTFGVACPHTGQRKL